MRAISRPVKRLAGQIKTPGDKSCSHRALILAAMAPGQSKIQSLLASEDVLATANALQTLGAICKQSGPEHWNISGTSSFLTPDTELNMGNSGTGARLMMGVAAGRQTECLFTGDHSLSSRPMARVLEPLARMGARYQANNMRLPIRILGGYPLNGICYAPPQASAQIKSALLLAGLHAEGTTQITEARRTRTHTETMLPLFGATLEQKHAGKQISIQGKQTLHPTQLQIPGDPSSAAFLCAASIISPNSSLNIKNVMTAPERDGFLHAATAMGAKIRMEATENACGESCAHMHVLNSELKAFNPPSEHAASMIDEYPIFAVLAAFASGDCHVRGVDELRHKESNRIQAITAMLQTNGVEAEETEDGFHVQGCNGPPPGGGNVKSHGDHRIAMAALVMGSAAQAPVRVDDVSAIATSYPQFFEHMHQIGADMETSST